MKNIRLLEEIGVELDSRTRHILKILEKENEANEKFLAKALGTKINAVRKSLYKLMHSGFVSYNKKKDKDKKWWYIYYWKLKPQRIREVWAQKKKKELRKRKRELEEEQELQFECERGCRRFTYKEALSNEFKCPHCDSGMVQISNGEEVEKLKKEIKEIEKELSGEAKEGS